MHNTCNTLCPNHSRYMYFAALQFSLKQKIYVFENAVFCRSYHNCWFCNPESDLRQRCVLVTTNRHQNRRTLMSLVISQHILEICSHTRC